VQSPRVVIAETVSGSPAETAGLLVGDQIISVDGDMVTSSDQFITRVSMASLDQPLTLGYVRGAQRDTVSISPVAWDTVFASTDTHTTLKPVAPEITVAPVFAYPANFAYYNPYYISNVSPVVVPLSWYGYSPYGYTYWNYPYYYGNYPGYFYYGSSAYWNYAWPYGVRYGGPYPGPVNQSKAASEMDSAGQPSSDGGRTVSRTLEQPDA